MGGKIRLCDTTDVAPGEMRQGELPGGHKVAIYNVDGVFYVTDDLCTHGQSSLSDEGMLEGKIVECSWHFGAFDVTTGVAVQMPCRDALRTWAVTVEDSGIHVDADEAANA